MKFLTQVIGDITERIHAQSQSLPRCHLGDVALLFRGEGTTGTIFGQQSGGPYNSVGL